MKVTIIKCGHAVNVSEQKAISRIEDELRKLPGNDEWFLLTNLTFSVTNQFQSDEIDIIAISPQGIRLIEVKHWFDWEKNDKPSFFEREAEKVTSKAKRLTSLRKDVPDIPQIDGVILLTQESSRIKKLLHLGRIHGVSLHSLAKWKDALGVDRPAVLRPVQVELLCRRLEPRSGAKIDGSLRRMAGYVNLVLTTPRDDSFHRVYKGQHPVRMDKVVLHLYDISAGTGPNLRVKAEREFRTLHKLWAYPWAPKIMDSFQDVPDYPGEMCFFTIADPDAPSLEKRSEDKKWTLEKRILFARDAINAVREFHQCEKDHPLTHRNISPNTILVQFDNKPIITGYDRVRITEEVSVASHFPSVDNVEAFLAPEVRRLGLHAADQRSDIFSLCSSLKLLFSEDIEGEKTEIVDVLERGREENPDGRLSLDKIAQRFDEITYRSQVTSHPESEVVTESALYWSEGQTINDNKKKYRIVSKLGSGGIGSAFKVVQLNNNQEEYGTYVAKTVRDTQHGMQVLKSYQLVRPHLGQHQGLSPIYEIASDWNDNRIIALLKWIDGTPLSTFSGLFPCWYEEMGEASSETLAIRLLREVCEALGFLHGVNLVHGDVSPKNLIVSGHNIVLTDYDFVAKVGDKPFSPGTILYCSPEREALKPVSPSDDLFALAASFFHVLFDREPFQFEGSRIKNKGLNWNDIKREEYPHFSKILDQIVHPDTSQRLRSTEEILSVLPKKQTDVHAVSRVSTVTATPLSTSQLLSEQEIEWLKSLLQSYPGSRWGNQETRGLDTEFASNTYVETSLEQRLMEDITQRKVKLVILCGNAGDGKTAFLQHLFRSAKLGKECKSSQRILEGQFPNGPRVCMNLDGSASWNGKSADTLLDEFFEPFQNGNPEEDIVHLLAVNDGRLLEWVERFEMERGETKLTERLKFYLAREKGENDEDDLLDSPISFINLNHRSLVGGILPDKSGIDVSFLDKLIDHLYGGEEASRIWNPCCFCAKHDICPTYNTGQLFGPSSFPNVLSVERRSRARERLYEGLQAVHLRGEKHITVRELRATLVYVLFGVHYCSDLHDGVIPADYWDRAFDANSCARQGEILHELSRFDPAMDVHPKMDRYLLSLAEEENQIPHYPGLLLASARRRAFFEWSEDSVKHIAGDPLAFGLARGKHLKTFRDISLNNATGVNTVSNETTRKICQGISHLENLPEVAKNNNESIPLRIAQRTLTETVFWVEKALAKFSVEPVIPSYSSDIEQLHRQVNLIYRYQDGSKEILQIGFELFQLLLELGDGYQLYDTSSDDIFANLSLFVKRLVQEDEKCVMAWTPIGDDEVYKISIEQHNENDKPRQNIVIRKELAASGEKKS